jgi:hypothetical protein
MLKRIPAGAYDHDHREQDQHSFDEPFFGFGCHFRHLFACPQSNQCAATRMSSQIESATMVLTERQLALLKKRSNEWNLILRP